MSGTISTEYAAHAAAQARAIRSPFNVPATLPEPTATSATPPNDTAAASQKPLSICSSRKSHAKIPTKTGVVPSTSATVDAVEYFSAYTKQNWFVTTRRAVGTTNTRT